MVTDGEGEKNLSHRVRGEVQSEHQPAREEQADRNCARREAPGGGAGHGRRHFRFPGISGGARPAPATEPRPKSSDFTTDELCREPARTLAQPSSGAPTVRSAD